MAPSLLDNDSRPRLRLTASTMSAPEFCHMRTMSGISDGGCCPSASITITASPRACSSPAHNADSLPKLRLSRKAQIASELFASLVIMRQVSSGEPSSTSTSSYDRLHWLKELRTAVKKLDNCAPSRKTGMTTERSDCLVWVLGVCDSSISGNGSGRDPYIEAPEPARKLETEFGRDQTQWKSMRIRKPVNIAQASSIHQ